MTKSGLQQSIEDPGVFFRNQAIIIATHIDYMATISPNQEIIKETESTISQYVELEKLRTPSKLLGMELTWGHNNKWVKLTQKTAIGNLAREFGKTTTIPTKSLPLNLNEYAKNQEETTPELQKKYQSLVGSLLNITRHTRPEITLHTNLLGRRTSLATPSNMKTGPQVLRYLASSSGDGVVIRKTNQEQILEKSITTRGCTDASYGGEKARSQSGSL